MTKGITAAGQGHAQRVAPAEKLRRVRLAALLHRGARRRPRSEHWGGERVRWVQRRLDHARLELRAPLSDGDKPARECRAACSVHSCAGLLRASVETAAVRFL